jgi:hypothetical protein
VDHDRSVDFDTPADDLGAPQERPVGGASGGHGGAGARNTSPEARPGVALHRLLAITGLAPAALLWATGPAAPTFLAAAGLWALVALRRPSRPPPWGHP